MIRQLVNPFLYEYPHLHHHHFHFLVVINRSDQYSSFFASPSIRPCLLVLLARVSPPEQPHCPHAVTIQRFITIMSSKSVPRCSLQTASSIRGDLRLPSTWASSSQDTKASNFSALPPSPAPHNSNHSHPQRVRKPRASWWCCVRTPLLRWGCNHSQLCFLLLYVGCTYASGLYASTLFANGALRALRVPDAIASAQHAYEKASLELRNASGCVVETSLSHMLEIKVAIETARRRLNAAVQANARALDQLEDGVQACTYVVELILIET